jgi:hypothetical protein
MVAGSVLTWVVADVVVPRMPNQIPLPPPGAPPTRMSRTADKLRKLGAPYFTAELIDLFIEEIAKLVQSPSAEFMQTIQVGNEINLHFVTIAGGGILDLKLHSKGFASMLTRLRAVSAVHLYLNELDTGTVCNLTILGNSHNIRTDYRASPTEVANSLYAFGLSVQRAITEER